LGGVWSDFPSASSTQKARDPGQQLVFMGQDLNRDAIIADLERCLLTGAEDKKFATALRKIGPSADNLFPDPFAVWEELLEDASDEEEEDEEDEEA
jgi:hypothetical protein